MTYPNNDLTTSPKHWFSNTRRNHVLALCVSAVLAIGIAYFTLTPNPSLKLTSGDKIAHLLGFAILLLPGALLYRHALYWLLPSAIAFGGAIEIIQPYVNRKGEWGDFFADAAGAIIGITIGLFLRYIFRKFFVA